MRLKKLELHAVINFHSKPFLGIPTSVRECIRGIINDIDSFLKIKDLTREDVIKLSRDIVRESGYVITYIHKGNYDIAQEKLRLVRNYVSKFKSKINEHPELAYSGLTYSTLAEYVEAEVFYSIVTSKKVPSHKDLDIHPIPYIQGLLDVVGEIKRYVIELIRKGNFKDVWEFFEIAEAIYEEARGLDYPEALVPGLRRKIDIARSVIESLRSFIIDIESRNRLVSTLGKVLDVIEK